MSASAPSFCSPEMLQKTACPACHGALRLENGRVFCSTCGRAYPVEDGIAVLIAERAGETKK